MSHRVTDDAIDDTEVQRDFVSDMIDVGAHRDAMRAQHDTLACLASLNALSADCTPEAVCEVLLAHREVRGVEIRARAHHVSHGVRNADLADARDESNELSVRLWASSPDHVAALQTLATLALARVGARSARAASESGPISTVRVALTDRHARVAELVARGLANKEIAAELDVAEVTVERIVTQLFRHHGVRRRSELAVVLLDQSQPDD